MAPRTRSVSPVFDRKEAVVVCTPYSTGCCMALEMQQRGYNLLVCWNKGFSEVMKTHVPDSCSSLKYAAEVDERESLAETAAALQEVADANGWAIVSVVCGGEAGVDLADALSEYMGVLTNGTEIANRRDKKVQQELVRATGLRAVRQSAGRSLEEVQAFLETEQYPLIVKPVDSAGSDGVKLCRTYEEAKDHVLSLLVYEKVNGGVCSEVVCQEFLQGKEYVVDQCSRDGVHKTVMLWVYDKHPANGADFVYYGMIPVDSESPEAKLLIPYARGVLDALGIQNGPSHGEFIMTATGPALVEMNVRAHGKDGYWQSLCRALTGGYNQVDAAVDCYLDPENFMCYPDKPPSPFKAAGRCVDLVSYTSGIVKSCPGYDIIRSLPSFVCLETHIKQGSKISPTIDLATDNGCLVLMNKEQEALDRDVAIIRQLETDRAMFELYDNTVGEQAQEVQEEDAEDKEWEQRRQQLLSKPCSLEFATPNDGAYSNQFVSPGTIME
mmetsp:Transcript_22138/g.35661  ORF Transcript_22138/g.35661 Transcript_22138/m.35661 type:complete len:497 (+) Transcript_22138:172-1662(+)